MAAVITTGSMGSGDLGDSLFSVILIIKIYSLLLFKSTVGTFSIFSCTCMAEGITLGSGGGVGFLSSLFSGIIFIIIDLDTPNNIKFVTSRCESGGLSGRNLTNQMFCNSPSAPQTPTTPPIPRHDRMVAQHPERCEPTTITIFFSPTHHFRESGHFFWWKFRKSRTYRTYSDHPITIRL